MTVAEFVKRSRRAQSLPPKIADASILRKIAALFQQKRGDRHA